MRKLMLFVVLAVLFVVAVAPAYAGDQAEVEQALGLSPDLPVFGCPDDCYYAEDVCLHYSCTIDMLTGTRHCACDVYGDCCECAGLPSCSW